MPTNFTHNHLTKWKRLFALAAATACTVQELKGDLQYKK